MEVRGVICRNWQTLSGAAICALPYPNQRWQMWALLCWLLCSPPSLFQIICAGFWSVTIFLFTVMLLKRMESQNEEKSDVRCKNVHHCSVRECAVMPDLTSLLTLTVWKINYHWASNALSAKSDNHKPPSFNDSVQNDNARIAINNRFWSKRDLQVCSHVCMCLLMWVRLLRAGSNLAFIQSRHFQFHHASGSKGQKLL